MGCFGCLRFNSLMRLRKKWKKVVEQREWRNLMDDKAIAKKKAFLY
jgi:hypothetical protein